MSDTPLIPPKPLVCLSGERPPMVPYITEACNVDVARTEYEEAVTAYESGCTNPHPCDVLDPEVMTTVGEGIRTSMPWCNDYFSYCKTAGYSLPIHLKNLGSDRVAHPFMDIVYYGDQWIIDDFRSANIFDQAADDMLVSAWVGKTPNPVFLYPASGSHMSPFLIPLKLIDRGQINSAKIIYTEMDEKAKPAIEEYLRFMARPEIGIFSPFTSETIKKKPNKEITTYHLSYKGVPIEFVFYLNRRGDDELYTPESHIYEADFIVFHDGVMDDLEKKHEVATKFYKKLVEYSKGDQAKLRLVLSENDEDCQFAPGRCVAEEMKWPHRAFDGFYACQGEHGFGTPTYLSESYENPALKRQKADDVIRRGDFYHLGRPNSKKFPGAILIAIPPQTASQ